MGWVWARGLRARRRHCQAPHRPVAGPLIHPRPAQLRAGHPNLHLHPESRSPRPQTPHLQPDPQAAKAAENSIYREGKTVSRTQNATKNTISGDLQVTNSPSLSTCRSSLSPLSECDDFSSIRAHQNPPPAGHRFLPLELAPQKQRTGVRDQRSPTR